MNTVRILHFSDVLCVWAYVSQVRIDELRRTFGAAIEIDCRFVTVFGDARGKLLKNWGERGGNAAYNQHVREIVARFGHVDVHPDIWLKNVPHSALPAHVVLCAVRCLEAGGQVAPGSFDRLAWRLRQAFFTELADVSAHDVLGRLGAEAGLPMDAIDAVIASGEAHAALAVDLEMAREHDVRASPTLLFNEGRQRLTGNVGYRIIEANVREFLESPSGQHSWC